jgi:hypothetical protein
MIGESEHQDIPTLASAFASVRNTADPSQYPVMDAMLNLPEPELSEVGQGGGRDTDSGGTTLDDDDENEAGNEGRSEEAE